ncbi:vacuolar protein sorting/targeting protein PEP1 [Coelomomyces lativittatus]|nr:vacuolar protein sorting/targeting protein PEP1 [Coelomomyces lativittatus]
MNYEEGDWLLYAGTYCDNDDTHLVNTTTTTSNNNCKTYPFYSITKGKQWHYLMLPELTQCIWARTNLFTLVPKSAILCSLHSQVVYSEDFFHTYHLVLNHTSRFAIYGDYFIALSTKNKEIDSQVNNLHPSFLESKEDKEKKDELYLHVSLDAQHFGRALFPNIKPPSNAPVHPPSMSFTVLPAHKGALYINLPQYQTSLGGLGRLYKSNFNGTRFTLMHEATFWSTQRNSYGFVDIELLQSIPGFMVANFVTNADAIMNPLDSSTVVPFQKKTFFSLDEGSTWQQFKPPEHDALNQPYPCGPGFKDFPECQLHFHLYLDRVDPQHVMDASSAPGLLLGVGHVQPTLGAFKDANTYLTRDAGQTWFEIFKGPHQFEFGDHGSVIVLVHAFQPTHQLLYSFDDGRSFLSLPLSSPPRNFTLLNIFTHPNATLERFVITGVWETNTPNDPQGPSKKYVVFFVDFSSAREGTCQFDPQNKFNSDFEAWTLSDQCVFGKKTTYYRRKPGKTCAIRNTFKLYEHSDQRCPCTKQDFECDYNYEMNDSGECVTTQPPLDLACDDQPYWVPSGYRKRSSTVCEGGLMLDAPKKYTCPRPLSSSFSIYFGLLMILAVGGLAYVFSVVYKRLKNSGVDFHIPGSSFVTGLFSDLQYRFQYRPVGSYGRNDTSLLGED